MEEIWKNSAIITKRNVDDNQNPVSVQLYELKQVIDVHSCIVLNQLPDEFQGIEIEGFTQVYDIDKISTRNFKVDYANGVLYFHPNNIGKMLHVNYYGTGCTLLSASRIYTKYDKYGNVLETLEELIDKAKLYLKAIESLGGAVEVINKLDVDIEAGSVLHENLTEDIKVGTQVKDELIEKTNIANTTITNLIDKTNKGNDTVNRLDSSTANAVNKKQELDNSITEAIETNTILSNTNETALQTDLILKQTIASGQDSIDKINATGNKSLTIGASQFLNNEYTWTHSMNSKELNVSMYDADTDEPLMLDCKLIGLDKILVRNSSEHPNIRVVLSASYYQGNSAIGTTIEDFAGDSIDVGSKKVRLKDENGIVKTPVTNSDAVFMPDGKTKLTKKIDDMNKETKELKNYLNIMPIDGDVNKIKFKKVLKSNLPVLDLGEPILCTDTKELYVGTSSGNLKIIDENELSALSIKQSNFEKTTNNSLALKQPITDNSFATTSKTVKGAIGELKSETSDLKNKLTYVTTVSPTLGSGLTAFDDTVENLMTLSMDGFVNYSFCVTGGKSNNNISNGAVLCTIPQTIPVPKITYGIANLETTGGERRLAMTVLNPNTRAIMLYFIGDTTAVSSAKGTITWRVPSP